MCGIVTLLGNDTWSDPADLSVFHEIANDLERATGDATWAVAGSAVDRLSDNFGVLMSFGVHHAVATDPRERETFGGIARKLRAVRDDVDAHMRANGRTDELERLKERLSDYLWQLEVELDGNISRVDALFPPSLAEPDRASRFLAWSIERVLESLDKLEVRGRDSAGISILLSLGGDAPIDRDLPPALRDALRGRHGADETDAAPAIAHHDASGRWLLRVAHKVANLVGHLGDNGAALRAAIRKDALLWALAPRLRGVNILCHTRWASNGIINIANCHPVDGRTYCGEVESPAGRAAMFVLNGDVDNHLSLVTTSVESRGHCINPAVSTDAKILPVLLALDDQQDEPLDARFMRVMRRCHGSLAIALQHLDEPQTLLVGQKGSGQALYVGRTNDGWLVASEVYGLAALCRSYWPMNTGGGAGVAVELRVDDGMVMRGTSLSGPAPWMPPLETMQIFARDIFRGDFPTYIEKEVSEAPSSVRKTLAGKYAKRNEGVDFLLSGFGNGDKLLRRLSSSEKPRIRRIIVIGQGTASIAAMGVAFLVRRALAGSGISVESGKASELFGFMAESRYDDAIVVAVSQSGTTTDTNRIVDLAHARGAWIHAIVNRRNSALVQKADSHLYTSDGRDVEMAVASTKAYYSQVVAGTLFGLLLAAELRTMTRRAILEQIERLEALPGKIESVLARREEIAALARTCASARNWALVGSGPNRIAAEEIRIKMSELCYKAIPCDVTEDKKHIDLSTEPLTIVIANDLPEMVVQDSVKEVSIFKAHNGRPIVLCAEGENRFDGVAEATVPLPTVGGGLDFVVATVAGHLFGIAAAQAIDRAAIPFREVRAILSRTADNPERFRASELSAAIRRGMDTIESGEADSALPARLVAVMARYLAWLETQPPTIAAADARLDEAVRILNKVIEELTRPIDTIRHQAKTVTVGISRPQREISPLVQNALSILGIPEGWVQVTNRGLLEVVSPLISEVEGGILYEVTGYEEGAAGHTWTLQAVRAIGRTRLEDSRYRTPQVASGTKRRALRTGTALTSPGPAGDENLIVVPLTNPAGNTATAVVLLHVALTPAASLQQKTELLRGIHEKYDELIEALAERAGDLQADDVIREAPPRLLAFKSVDGILEWWATRQRSGQPSAARS